MRQKPAGRPSSSEHIIRWHDNPKIIYELIGGLQGEFRGHRLTINDQGFRGPRNTGFHQQTSPLFHAGLLVSGEVRKTQARWSSRT